MFYKCKYFNIKELVPPEVYNYYKDDSWMFLMPSALMSLDALREYYNKSITVNDWSWGGNLRYRGFRPFSYEGGGKLSQHRFGNGFDCTIKDISAEQARQDIIREKDTIFTMITCLEANVSWLHFDCRNIPDRMRIVYP